ncbi:DUF2141 domain-containing protein [Aliamphritea ceti]|uniref:DUF2141 domain-containing protein n=1 Tax=Aliamphritea ceti TaxID=1524258 RepID=UPI0021C399B0|nr:DUF2141 domain-containing protein [Aliamphritea ceti]
MKAGLGWLMAILMSGAVQATDLEVRVDNLQSTKGQVIIELVNQQMYESEADLEALYSVVLETRVPSVQHIFRELPPGDYAIQVIHDLNSNYDLDFNVFTGPSEPLGLSRIKRVELENLPDWQRIKFSLQDLVIRSQPVVMTVTLN